jgi:hypothetical protein
MAYNPDELDNKKENTTTHNRNKKNIKKGKYILQALWPVGQKRFASFLKYFPNKRDKCYYAMAFDMYARPRDFIASY